MGPEGVTETKPARAFVLTTRRVKEYLPRNELFNEWAEEEYGLDEREIVSRREFTQPTIEQARENLSDVLDALTKDKAASRRGLFAQKV
jgi:hypothetical protein